MNDPDKMVSLGEIATRDGALVKVHRDYEDLFIGDFRLTPEAVASLEDKIAEWKRQVNDYILRADADEDAAPGCPGCIPGGSDEEHVKGCDFGPEAYKSHRPGCDCWDCKAYRADEA